MNSLQHGRDARIDVAQCQPKGPERTLCVFKIHEEAAAQTVLNWWCFSRRHFTEQFKEQLCCNELHLNFDLYTFLKSVQDPAEHLSLPHYAYNTCQTNAAAIRPLHEYTCCVGVSNNASYSCMCVNWIHSSLMAHTATFSDVIIAHKAHADIWKFWPYPAVPHFAQPLRNRYFPARLSTFDMTHRCSSVGWLL